MRFELMKMGGCADDESNTNEIPCNGRGECVLSAKGNESCICEIKFTGDFCLSFNKTYHAGEFTAHLHSLTFELIFIFI